MKREDILQRAAEAVCGSREENYGGPEDNFNRIANLWNAYLGQVDLIGPEDVAVMMILLKTARIASSEYQSEDSWIDVAGYAACGAEIAYKGGTF